MMQQCTTCRELHERHPWRCMGDVHAAVYTVRSRLPPSFHWGDTQPPGHRRKKIALRTIHQRGPGMLLCTRFTKGVPICCYRTNSPKGPRYAARLKIYTQVHCVPVRRPFHGAFQLRRRHSLHIPTTTFPNVAAMTEVRSSSRSRCRRGTADAEALQNLAPATYHVFDGDSLLCPVNREERRVAPNPRRSSI